MRDDISKLTRSRQRRCARSREQLAGAGKALEPRKAERRNRPKLLESSEEVVKKAEALEDRLHNPTAEVVYDILAMRGGTRLYSRLAPLQMWAIEADGPPTAGMTQVLDQQEGEFSRLKEEVQGFLTRELGPLNATAARLGLQFVNVK